MCLPRLLPYPSFESDWLALLSHFSKFCVRGGVVCWRVGCWAHVSLCTDSFLCFFSRATVRWFAYPTVHFTNEFRADQGDLITQNIGVYETKQFSSGGACLCVGVRVFFFRHGPGGEGGPVEPPPGSTTEGEWVILF